MQKVQIRLIRFLITLLFLSLSGSMFILSGQTAPACSMPCGDVNNDGTATIVDALMIAQYYVGILPPVFNSNAADVDLSGSVNIIDALIVAQYYVGLITALPYGQKTPTPTRTPDLTITRTSTPTPVPTPSPTPHPDHITGNPFSGARWYVNPLWSANASAGGGSAIANFNTAVWFDSINSITAGTGLRGHLDNALAQDADLILLVLYNLPNRSCREPVLNSELLVSEDGLNRYKTEFIDPIAAVLSDPAYKGLRIAVLIEPHSLVYLISGLDSAACHEVGTGSIYQLGIQYALNRLHQLPNIYCYIDIGRSSWMGWVDNYPHFIEVIARTVNGTDAGYGSADGFVSNVANYDALEEPFLPDPNLEVGGKALRSSVFFDWNSHFDELDYIQTMYTGFLQAGFPDTIGMLIDTSRNGWGGPERPAAVSTAGDMNTYVDQSRVDRRTCRSNWCNVIQAGLGARPQAAPASRIDAFIWAKPPGESDGISTDGIPDPNDPSRKFHPMCDPDGINIYNPNFGTDAIPDSPHKGYWSQAAFTGLLRNAYPPVH